MVVTEIAFIRFKSASPEPLENLAAGLAVQNEWHAKTYPHLPSSFPGSICFQRVDEPTEILITARWESVAAHWNWIKSEENVKVMDTLGKYISQEHKDDLTLLHVGGDHFGEPPAESLGEMVPLLDSPIISIDRMMVDGGKKVAFAREVDRLQDSLRALAVPHMVRGSWRQDTESDEKHEYVVVGGWQPLGGHTEVVRPPRFVQFEVIRPLATTWTTRHYRRLL